MTKCIIEMEDGYKTCSYSDIQDWGSVLVSNPSGNSEQLMLCPVERAAGCAPLPWALFVSV